MVIASENSSLVDVRRGTSAQVVTACFDTLEYFHITHQAIGTVCPIYLLDGSLTPTSVCRRISVYRDQPFQGEKNQGRHIPMRINEMQMDHYNA